MPMLQAGNPKPRVFHLLEDSALINRYGFPSQGHTALLRKLEARGGPSTSTASRPLLAVNLGKNKTSAPTDDDDYVSGVRKFAAHADALVINVSSPNTPGLRGLQDPAALDRLLAACTAELKAAPRRPRLLLKLAPDLDADALTQIAHVVVARGVDGVIISNTTISRPAHLSHRASSRVLPDRAIPLTLKLANKAEMGGLSGPPVKPLALTAIRVLRSHMPASVPIIGCGGVGSGADALEFAQAGASAVQMYTAFGYDGPGAPRRVKDELTALLKKQGKTWAQVVKEGAGQAARQQPQAEKLLDTLLVKEPRNSKTEVDMLIQEAKDLSRRLDELAASK
jgi:dihydroorotate dehydrogenase